MTMIDVVCS